MLVMPELTKHGKLMLEAIRNYGDWLDRPKLAELLGKNRLNPNDLRLLQGLLDMGLITRDEQTVGITTKHLYRIVS